MKELKSLKLAALMAGLFLAATGVAHATALTIETTENWTAITGGSGTGGLPGASDTITIKDGVTLTVNTNTAVCASIALGSDSEPHAGSGTLAFDAGDQVTVSGTVTVGDVTETGSIDMSSGGTLIADGFTISDAGTWTPGSGTVEVAATATLPASFLTTFNNLIINTGTTTLGVAVAVTNLTIQSGAALSTSSSSYGITFDGNYTNLNASGTSPLTGNASAITIAGTGTQYIDPITTTGTETVTKTGGTATFTDVQKVGGLTINGSGGTLNLGTGLNHTNTGTLTMTAGTLNGGSSTLYQGGSVSGTGATFAAGTGTVDCDAAAAQTIGGWAYNNLIISGSGTAATLGAAVTVTNLTINSGTTLSTSGSSYGVTFYGNYTNLNASGTSPLTGNASAITIAGTGTQYIDPITTTGTETVTKTGGTATFTDVQKVGGLTINGSGGTLNLGAGLNHTNTGTLTMTAGTLNGGSSTLYQGGSVSGTGATFAAGTGTVDCDAAAAQTIGGWAYNNLIISGSGTAATLGAAVTVTNLTINSGTTLSTSGSSYGVTFYGNYTNLNASGTSPLTGNASAITIAGTGTQYIDPITTTGTETVTKTGGTATFTDVQNVGGLTMNGSGGTLNLGVGLNHTNTGTLTMTAGTLNGGSSTLYQGGSVSGTVATFAAGTGTVDYDAAAAQTIGGWTYNNLIISGSGTAATLGAAVTVTNLTINSGTTLSTSGSSYGMTFYGNYTNLNASGTSPLTGNASAITIAGTGTQYIDPITTTGTETVTKTGGTATFTDVQKVGGLTMNGSGGTLNLGVGLSHTNTGTLTMTAGTLNGGSSTLYLSASGTVVSGTGATFTAGAGTVNYAAAAAQTVGALTYSNLTFSGSGAKTMATGASASGNLSIASGASANVTAGEDLTVDTLTLGGVLQLSGTWGSTTATTATHQNNTYFAATTGYLTVTTTTTPTFSSLTASPTVTYGATSQTLGGTVGSGSIYPTNGETITVSINGNAQTTTTTNATGGFSINYNPSTIPYSNTAYTITYSYPGNASLSTATNTSTTLTVNKATVTVTSGIAAVGRVYNGTTATTITSNNVVLAGVISGDTANVKLSTNSYTATFASASVGSAVGVTVGSMTLTGTAAGNYALTQPTGLTANITAATVTISSGITANAKVYNGTTAGTISSNTVVLVGVVSGDTANVALSTNSYTATFASASVASGVGVTVGGLTLTGSAAGNYTLTQPTGLTANITAATVTVSSGITANSKVYNGTTAATISSNSVVLAGVVAGDTANVALSTNSYTATFASASKATGVGVTVSGLTLTGTAAGNYALTQPTGLTANITAATVTITSGITANSKVYDGTTTATISSNSVVLAGVVAGDTANVALSTNGYTATFASASKATGVGVTVSGLTLTGTAAGNYALTQPTGLTANITAATVTITSGITANSKVYDGTTTATISSNSVVLAGVVAGDTANVALSTNGYTATFASASKATGVGVTVGSLTLTGTAAGNYTLTQPAGLTANITAATVTITSGITANNKVYDGTTTATISSNSVVLAGVVAGDTANVALSTNGYTATFAGIYASNQTVTVSGLTLTGSAAGNYSLTQPTGLTASITPVTVTVSSGITANGKVYDGTTTATISSNSVALSGVLGGDTANVKLSTNGYTATFASASKANGVVVSVGGLTLTGSAVGGYTLTQPTGFTANITAATVTISSGITANNKVYDTTTTATISSNSVVLAGVISGDTANVALSTNGYTATFASAAKGTGISVTVSGLTLTGSASANYSLTQPSLTANIIGAATALAVTSSLNPALPGSSVTFTGVVSSVTSGIGSPTGSVTFLTNGTSAGTVGLVSDVATITTALLPHGSNTVTVQYAGDANFAGVTNSVIEVVNTPPVTGTFTLGATENIAASVYVLKLMATVYDADGDVATLTGFDATSAQGGTISSNDLVLTYTPPVNVTGADSFNYAVTDGFGGVATGTVSITIDDGTALARNIVGLSVVGGHPLITFAGIPGYTYTIQATTSLTPPVTWTGIGSVTANSNGVVQFEDTNSQNYPSRYYRTTYP